MIKFYFPDHIFFDVNKLNLPQPCEILDTLQYDPEVTVAIIRPPEEFTQNHLLCFPSLQFVLSDTTGISHLSLCLNNPNLTTLTLRNISSVCRSSLTAASDHAFMLLELSLRPVLKASFDYLKYLDSIGDAIAAPKRSDFIGRTFNDTSIGLLGLGRIGQAILAKLPFYTHSVYIYDSDPLVEANLDSSTHPCSNICFVKSIQDLFLKSDSVVVAITDDKHRNTNLIDSSLLSAAKLHSIVNISRPYMVDTSAIIDALNSGTLQYYYSDFLPLFSALDLDQLKSLHNDGRMLSLPHMGGCTYSSWTNSLNYLLDLFSGMCRD